MDSYVRMYDQHQRVDGGNPTIGLINENMSGNACAG